MTKPKVTLKGVYERCERHEDCMLWTLGMKNGSPYWRRKAGHKETQLRRFVYSKKSGAQQLNMGFVVEPSCGNPRCLARAHLEVKKRSHQQVGTTMPLATRRKVSQTRRQQGKLAPEAVESIRNAESPTKAAAEHGISKAWACRIKSGIGWKDYSNPYLQLMEATQ